MLIALSRPLYCASMIVLVAAAMLCSVPRHAYAQDSASTSFPLSVDGVYHEIETKYIFGFTEGSDIGAEGETAVESETNAQFRKRHGGYSVVEQELEFEDVATQFFAYELSVHGTAHAISGVDGVNDLHRDNAGGLSANLRYLLLGRGPESPVGLTVTAEPEWGRVDGTTGELTRSFASTFKILADTELIENRLFAAVNLSYAPEVAKAATDPVWSRASAFGASGALAWRVSPIVTVGGEVEYYQAYGSVGFGNFQGRALYVGPTLHVQATHKIMVAAAFSTQVAGHDMGDDSRLDLVNFTRYKARLKLEYEF
jgi:hypothetical protein